MSFSTSKTLCKTSRRRWKIYVKLPVLQMPQYTIKITLQQIYEHVRAVKYTVGKLFFLLYFVRMFFHFRMKFHKASLLTGWAGTGKIVVIRHGFCIAICINDVVSYAVFLIGTGKNSRSQVWNFHALMKNSRWTGGPTDAWLTVILHTFSSTMCPNQLTKCLTMH